jgi:chromosome segregation ATPase
MSFENTSAPYMSFQEELEKELEATKQDRRLELELRQRLESEIAKLEKHNRLLNNELKEVALDKVEIHQQRLEASILRMKAEEEHSNAILERTTAQRERERAHQELEEASILRKQTEELLCKIHVRGAESAKDVHCADQQKASNGATPPEYGSNRYVRLADGIHTTGKENIL